MFDTAFDPVAAADIHVVVNPHVILANAQRASNLVLKLRHLDRGPDVEDLVPGVPRDNHPECLDR